MPDAATTMIFAYGVLVGGLMIYVICLGIRRALLNEKKARLEEENQANETTPPD